MLLCGWMRSLALQLAAILTIGGSLLSGQSDPKQLVQQAETRRKELQAEADTLAKQAASLLVELRRLEVDRQIRVEEVKKADATVQEVEQRVAAATAQVATLEAARQAESPWVKERLVELYKRGKTGYLRFLLTADGLRSIGRMSRGVAAVATIDRLRIDQHRKTVQEQRTVLAALQRDRVEADSARAAAVKARVALDRALAAHARRLDDLDRQRDLAARYIGELQTAQNDLQRSIATLPGSAPVLPIGPFRGALDWPATGTILSRFGRSSADRFGTAVVRNGIEISVAEGAPVKAVHDGVVAYAAPFRGFGTLVILDHGQNAFTLYGHLSQALVTNGRRVGRNEVIGHAGRTPDGEPAAYFELRIDGRPVDPVQWLRSPR